MCIAYAASDISPVLYGELYLCAGQSNMLQLSMTQSQATPGAPCALCNSSAEIRAAYNPAIRLMVVEGRQWTATPADAGGGDRASRLLPAAATPQNDTRLSTVWSAANPGVVANFSSL